MDAYEDQLAAALILQIRAEMVVRHMDQKDLSEAAGMERSALNRYLKGHRALPALTLFKVADASGWHPRNSSEKRKQESNGRILLCPPDIRNVWATALPKAAVRRSFTAAGHR